MKTEELSLGDWVLVATEGVPMQVSAIQDEKISLRVGQATAPAIVCGLKEIEPIPLTEGVVALNCIEAAYPPPGAHSYKAEGARCFQFVAMAGGSIMAFYGGGLHILSSVHEFQHVLRMFGYADLANSLKLS